MTKSISEQIDELQLENSRLKELDKLFEKALKKEFGYGKIAIHSALENAEKNSSFIREISSTFHLKNSTDFDDFVRIMCTENSVKYFESHRITTKLPAMKQG